MPNRPRHESLAAALCALYALVMSAWYAVWRAALAERSADEGMFENLLWNAAHGHGLRTAIENDVHHLAVHFSPALYLFVPLYRVFPSMHVVHVVVTALVAIAGFVFYRHALRALGPRDGLAALGAFLLCPTLVLQTFMEFHEQALVILPLTILLSAWLTGRRTAMLLSAAALLTVREDNALLVLALACLSLFDAKRRANAAPLVALGLGCLLLWHYVGVGLLGNGKMPGVLAGTYTRWGETPGEILQAMVSQPLTVLRHLLSPVPIRYMVFLLAPTLGLLPFGSALAWVAVPQLAMILLANHESRMFQIRMHYSVAPAIVMLFAAVQTLSRLESSRGRLGLLVRSWAPRAMLAICVLLTPGWAIRAVKRLNPYRDQISRVLAAVPDTASVSAPGYLVNALAARQRIGLIWSESLPATSYVVLEDSSRLFFAGTTVDAFHSARFDSLLAAGGYRKTFERDGWHVYGLESSDHSPAP